MSHSTPTSSSRRSFGLQVAEHQRWRTSSRRSFPSAGRRSWRRSCYRSSSLPQTRTMESRSRGQPCEVMRGVGAPAGSSPPCDAGSRGPPRGVVRPRGPPPLVMWGVVIPRGALCARGVLLPSPLAGPELRLCTRSRSPPWWACRRRRCRSPERVPCGDPEVTHGDVSSAGPSSETTWRDVCGCRTRQREVPVDRSSSTF